MIKEKLIELSGEVIKQLPAQKYRVKLETGTEIITYLSGRMTKNKISILPGDLVDVEISPYDLSKGRIVYRKT